MWGPRTRLVHPRRSDGQCAENHAARAWRSAKLQHTPCGGACALAHTAPHPRAQRRQRQEQGGVCRSSCGCVVRPVKGLVGPLTGRGRGHHHWSGCSNRSHSGCSKNSVPGWMGNGSYTVCAYERVCSGGQFPGLATREQRSTAGRHATAPPLRRTSLPVLSQRYRGRPRERPPRGVTPRLLPRHSCPELRTPHRLRVHLHAVLHQAQQISTRLTKALTVSAGGPASRSQRPPPHPPSAPPTQPQYERWHAAVAYATSVVCCCCRY